MKVQGSRTRMAAPAARVFWQRHIDACGASGLRQVEYCRQQGLKPKYMTYWKRKLRAPSIDALPPPSVKSDPPRGSAALPAMIPVIVKVQKPSTSRGSAAALSPPKEPLTSSVRVTLPNGILVSLELASASFGHLLRELARLPC